MVTIMDNTHSTSDNIVINTAHKRRKKGMQTYHAYVYSNSLHQLKNDEVASASPDKIAMRISFQALQT